MFESTKELLDKIRADYSDCDKCVESCGIIGGASRIAGPCGQQNCWGDIYITRILEDEEEYDDFAGDGLGEAVIV